MAEADLLIIVGSEPLSHTPIQLKKESLLMWKIIKFSLQSGLELITILMINKVLTN